MVMPLPQQLRATTAWSTMPASPVKPSRATAGSHDFELAQASVPSGSERSPSKSHPRGLAVGQWPPTALSIATTEVMSPTSASRSPQKLKDAVREQAVVEEGDEARRTAMPMSSGPVAAPLRAATLQVMLGLLEQDDANLRATLPLLHLLSKMPLQDEAVRRECFIALQQIQAEATTGHGNGSGVMRQEAMHVGSQYHPLSRQPRPQAKPKSTSGVEEWNARDSGRAKSGVSLGHCKEFLLACANEIHDLEEVNPWFDYAETTGSENGDLDGIWRGCGFDYATVAETTHSVRTDDRDGDQATELSELLIRAGEEMSSGDESGMESASVMATKIQMHATSAGQRQALLTAHMEKLKRMRAFRAWAEQTMRQRAARPVATPAMGVNHDLATKYHVFAALKQAHSHSLANVARKHRVLCRLKRLLSQPSSSSLSCSSSTSAAMKMAKLDGGRFIAVSSTSPPSPVLMTRAFVRSMIVEHQELLLMCFVALALQPWLTRL